VERERRIKRKGEKGRERKRKSEIEIDRMRESVCVSGKERYRNR